MCAEALQIVGDSALVRREFGGEITDSAGDSLERQLRDSSTNLFGGGSNDVQRDIIGFHGLGLPR
jgi:alkylation response protein AidB-like acyl-CoA dehydrogenase